MSREELGLSRIDFAAVGESDDQSIAVLAVGEAEEWLRRGNRIPSEGGIMFVSIDQMTGTFLARVSPGVVISPALSYRFDCIDLAQILYDAGYKGRYRAVTRDLPNPVMVEREIADLCPGLDFAILLAN